MHTNKDRRHQQNPEELTTLKSYPSSRELLEQTYVDVAVSYVNEATDIYHSFDNDDVRDLRFNMHYATNMFPRFRSLNERESSEASDVRARLTSLYELTLLAQLALLAGREVIYNDLEITRAELAPSVIYRGILQVAGVFVDGVHTQQLSHSGLAELCTEAGDSFAQHFLERVRSTTQHEPVMVNQPVSSLQLVA